MLQREVGRPAKDYGKHVVLLTEANHFGNASYPAGRKLECDHAAMRATNAPEADKYITREYRSGLS